VKWGDSFSLSITDFRRLIETFIKLTKELANELLLGLELAIRMAELKDNIIDVASSHSFLTHPSNGLEGRHIQLLKEAITSCRSRLTKNGQWNCTEVSNYRKLVRQQEEAFCGAMFTSCGQCPRSYDLFRLRCENETFMSRMLQTNDDSTRGTTTSGHPLVDRTQMLRSSGIAPRIGGNGIAL
jgi:hypothetical protein